MADSDERLALVYDEAVRALDRQAAAVDELRTRAATVLGAAALVAGFLGAEVLERHPKISGWSLAAVLAFTFVVIAVGSVLLPWRWTFVTSPSAIINDYIDTDDEVSLDQLRWAMALHHETNYDKNQRTRWKLLVAMVLATVALGVEVIAWLAAL